MLLFSSPKSARILRATSAIAVGAVVLSGTSLAGVEGKVKLTTVSHDPYKNEAAYHKTELGGDTFGWGDTVVAAFQTGRFPDGASTNIGFATTVDGGESWTDGFMPGTTTHADPAGPYERVANPVVAYDAKHDTWLVSMAATINQIFYELIVTRSTDGGVSWTSPTILASPPAGQTYLRGWLTCDSSATSARYGTCYEVIPEDGTLKLYTSTDGGENWSDAYDFPEWGSPAQAVVRPDGTLVVAYLGIRGDIFSVTSVDGGETFAGPFFVAEFDPTHGFVPFMRSYTALTSAIDGEGNVYLAWQDCLYHEDCATDDIIFSSSSDGEEWAEARRVPIEGLSEGVEHFAPGLAADTATSGDLSLTYYYFPTIDCTEKTCELYAGNISSTDGGSTWADEKKILGPIALKSLPYVESISSPGRFIGDYISTSIINGRAFPVIANAKKGKCKIEKVGSCHENMVAPTKGLAIKSGAIRAETEQVVAGGPKAGSQVLAPEQALDD